MRTFPDARRFRGGSAALLVCSIALVYAPSELLAQSRPRAKVKEKPAPLPELNRKVLEFAVSQKGQKVGNGMCATFAAEALKAAEARRVRPENASLEDDYDWGELIATHTGDSHPSDAILPGDILQFRDVQIVTVTLRGRSLRTETNLLPHHTAIVHSVKGLELKVLHQNVGFDPKTGDKRKSVETGTIRLKNLKEGTIWVYRPVEK